LACCWFFGFSLSNPIPDHSAISWNRRIRFLHTGIFQEIFQEIVRDNKRTTAGKHLYKVRCSTIERSFVDAKELHGYRYARFRGLESVQVQAFLKAACQNMKKIALHLTKTGRVKSNLL